MHKSFVEFLPRLDVIPLRWLRFRSFPRTVMSASIISPSSSKTFVSFIFVLFVKSLFYLYIEFYRFVGFIF